MKEDKELDEILAEYIMPAHQHNGIDKRAEAKQAILYLIDKRVQYGLEALVIDRDIFTTCGYGEWVDRAIRDRIKVLRDKRD